MFKPNAGQMRGFRVVRDPNGILFSPFEHTGTQYGYVITYGEGNPAIHDGNDWVSILTMDESEYEDKLQELLVQQGTAIAEAASSNQVYAELAAQMNIYAGAPAGVSGTADPNAETFQYNG